MERGRSEEKEEVSQNQKEGDKEGGEMKKKRGVSTKQHHQYGVVELGRWWGGKRCPPSSHKAPSNQPPRILITCYYYPPTSNLASSPMYF